MDAASHDQSFVSSFVAARKRTRYLSFLGKAKLRGKFLDKLSSGLELDVDKINILDASRLSIDRLKALLLEKGAERTCHVIADCSPLDGADMPLEEGLRLASSHSFGIILSCVPGSLALYKTEEPGPSFVLTR
jgi:hypothetical protein